MTVSITRQAEQIASAFFNERVKSVYPIIGKGSVNQIAVVEMSSCKAVIRMNDSGALRDYIKEKWCVEQAASVGVPGPDVLSVGTVDETAYMILSYVDGVNGTDSDVPSPRIWAQLGEFSRRIHAIRTEGYGENLADPERGEFRSPPHDGFDGSWLSFVQYNIDSLTEHDRLIELGVITHTESRRVQQLFESLQKASFRFGLNHGDLSLKNTMVNQAGQIILLDWGSAEVNIVPHGDIVQLLLCRIEGGRPDDIEFQAFLDGYGITRQHFFDMQHELNVVQLLRAFDKLRWAIDRKPDVIEAFAAYAKRVTGMMLK